MGIYGKSPVGTTEKWRSGIFLSFNFRSSLWDLGRIENNFPAVETAGYYRKSLRDKGQVKSQKLKVKIFYSHVKREFEKSAMRGLFLCINFRSFRGKSEVRSPKSEVKNFYSQLKREESL